MALRAGGVTKGVDPRLLEIINAASKSLPQGWTAQVTPHGGASSTHGRSGSLHRSGQAIDIQIYDPQGNPVPNYQNGTSFPVYQRFANAARAYQTQAYPQLNNQFNWGGYFSGPIGKGGKYGAMDLMHFSIGHEKGAAGNWESGLNPQAARAWGIPQFAGTQGLSPTRQTQQSQWAPVNQPFAERAPATVPIGNVVRPSTPSPTPVARPTPFPGDIYVPGHGWMSPQDAATVQATPTPLPTETPLPEESPSTVEPTPIPGQPAQSPTPLTPTISDLTFSMPSPDPNASPEGGAQFQPNDFQSAGETPPYLASTTQPAGGIDLPMVYGDNFSVAPEGSFNQSFQNYWNTPRSNDQFSNYLSSQALTPQQDFSAVPAGSYDQAIQNYWNTSNSSPLPSPDLLSQSDIVGGNNFSVAPQGSFAGGNQTPSIDIGGSSPGSAITDYWSTYNQGLAQNPDGNFTVQYDAQGNPSAVSNSQTPAANVGGTDIANFGGDLSLGSDLNVGYDQLVPNPTLEQELAANAPPPLDAGLPVNTWYQAAQNYWGSQSASTQGGPTSQNPLGGLNPTDASSLADAAAQPGTWSVVNGQPVYTPPSTRGGFALGNYPGIGRPGWGFSTNPGGYQGLGSVETFPGSGVYVTRGTAMDASGGSGQGTPTAGKRGIQGITAGPNAEDAGVLDKWGNQKFTNPIAGPQNAPNFPDVFGAYGPLFNTNPNDRLGHAMPGIGSYNAFSTIQFAPNRGSPLMTADAVEQARLAALAGQG